MIKEVKTTNFRKHRNLRQIFEPGLNAVRAPNEQGKTTVLEAIMYALFGTKALRTSIDEAVTWGCAPGSLKVEVVVGLGGLEFTFKRGKSGAEVLRDGEVIVTGQSEVSAYAATLLGVDLASAIRLMMSSQNGLRGSLEQGPKATAEMIESLANFDLFERILEAAQEKLTLGPTAGIEAQIERLSASITDVEEPNYAEIDGQIDEQQRRCDYLLSMKGINEQAQADVGKQLATVKAHNAAIDQADLRIKRCKSQLGQLEADELMAKQQLFEVDESKIDALRTQIADAKVFTDRRVAWLRFSTYVFPEENFWEGDEASFQSEVARVSALKHGMQGVISSTETSIKVSESKRTTSSVCGFCEQDVSQFPEVAKRNADLVLEISALREGLGVSRSLFNEHVDLLGALGAVAHDVEKQRRALAGIEQYVELVPGTWPQRVTWKGEVPNADAPDVKLLQKDLDHWLNCQRASAVASGRLEQIKSQRVEALSEAAVSAAARDELGNKLASADIVVHLEVLKADRAKTDSEISNAQDQVSTLRMHRVRREQEYKAALESAKKAENDLAAAKQALEEQSFNNALVKKIRGARPIISDKLWNTVLAAVSSMFSKMRGEASAVAKGKDGFTVNGQAVGSLSGSTLDLLGLAIRVALTKTFLPNCPLLILDEPFAACDEARSNSMLGFIQASGFQQILLVTHEDASESVADYLITLEAA